MQMNQKPPFSLPRKPLFPGLEKPYSPRPGVAKSMTIAIGFRAKDGVVLASDTQISEEEGKSYEAKIFSINKSQDSFLAYAGTTGVTKELVGTLKAAAKDLAGEELIKAIKSNYRRIHKEFYTDTPEAERGYAQILFTVREGKKVSIYGSEDGRRIYDLAALDSDSDDSSSLYLPIGTGATVARPYLATYYSKHLSVKQIVNLAIYTLWKTKPYAKYCGGPTNVIYIIDKQPDILDSNHTWHRLSKEEIEEIEDSFAFYEFHTKEMFLRFPDCEYRTDKEFSASLRYATSRLREYRGAKIKHVERKARKWEKENEEERKRIEKEEGL